MSSCLFISTVLLQFVGNGLTLGTPRVDPLVESKVGLIRGLRAPDADYSMFLGIPYAKVDEDNIFGNSVPYPNFEETFEAFDDTAICPQIEEFNKTIVGTLDCLHLNVFVPNAAASSNRLPVMVYIHGGGFDIGFFGRYIYGPKFLVRHDIVLVTLNYRLGPYGFMCPGIPEVPGNQGLKDQQTALKWVKENIEAFGGDANEITIFGESAGATSVDHHIYSNEENLFNKAILQSGVTLNPSLLRNSGVEGPLKLAAHLGLNTEDVKEALTFLATVNTNLVIAATNELGLSFRVCVEKKYDDDVENFLSDYPVNLNVPKAKNIQIMLGFTSDEGLSFYPHGNDEYLEIIDVIGEHINDNFEMDSQTLDEMSEVFRHFYFGNESNEETKRGVIDLVTDFYFVHPILRSAEKYFDNGAESIFSYMFSFVRERNLAKYKYGITFGGAAHEDEISYLFDISFMKDMMSEEEQVLVDRITTMWTNFVKYGDPTPETTDLLPVKWTPTTKDHYTYLNIDSELILEARPFNKRMAFLDLFFKMNEKRQIGYRDNDNNVFSKFN